VPLVGIAVQTLEGIMGNAHQLTRSQEIVAKIAEEELKVSALRAELETASGRLAELRRELAPLVPEGSQVALPADSADHLDAPVSNEEKIALFRSLFRGREDVFPLRWENSRTGKSGYCYAQHDVYLGGESPPESRP
jgi:hypothetical protein